MESFTIGVVVGMTICHLAYIVGRPSVRLTMRAADGVEACGFLLCPECKSPRNVTDYILEKCQQCSDASHVIVWLDDVATPRR